MLRFTGRPAPSIYPRAIVRPAEGRNPRWGCQRIAGELNNLSLRVSPSTVRRLLAHAGLLVRRQGVLGPPA